MRLERTSLISLGFRSATVVLAVLVSFAPGAVLAECGEELGLGAADCNGNGIPDSEDILPGELSFQSSRSFPAGEEPWSIAAGDLDDDGDPDLVTANRASHDVSVLLNGGDGSFAEPASYAVGDGPVAVALADLDGDEDLDIAAASSRAFNVSILYNDSKGGYSPRVSIDIGEVQRAIAAGDIDADGDTDLVVGTDNPVLLVIRNEGQGKFEKGGYGIEAGAADSIVIADFDRNGLLDIAASTGFDPDFTILFQNGFENYTYTYFGSTREGGSVMAAGDVDGDSYLDIIDLFDFNHPYPGRFCVTENKGDRTFEERPPCYDSGFSPRGVAAGDLDRDGKDDVVVANDGGDDLRVALGGNLDEGRSIPVVDGPHAVALADFDGDQRLDIAVAGSNSRNVAVLLQRADGSFPSPDRFRANTADRPFAIGAEFALTGDFDGDALPDIITLSGSQTDFLRNLGGRAIGGPDYIDVSASTGAAGDLDGDGDLDLAVTNILRRVLILDNPGNAVFIEGGSFAAGADPLSPALGDLDGDGDLDIVAADRGSDSVSVLENDGSAAFPDLGRLPVGGATEAVAVADLDGDGKVDIACAKGAADEVAVLSNQGSGSFGAPMGHLVGDDPRAVAAGDLDGDGDTDLASADHGSDTVSVLLDDGGGAFGPASALKTERAPISIALGDLDGDGNLEIAAGNSGSSSVSVFGSGATFAKGVHFFGCEQLSSIALGDLDRNGLLDIVATYAVVLDDDDTSSDYLSVLWNETRPPASRDRDASGRPDECESAAVMGLGPQPSSILIDGGSKAIAFVGSLEADSLEEDLVWTGAVFENVGPSDASALTARGVLHADTNRNGALDAGDESLGSAIFDPATQRLVFGGLSRVCSPGSGQAFLLVLDLGQDAPGPVPTAAIPAASPLLFLSALSSLAALALVSLRNRRTRRLAWAPALALLLLAAPWGCGGDGGDGAPATSRALLIQLVEVQAVGFESGIASTAEGLPLTAWSFDA